MMNEIRVETAIGTLVAAPVGDYDYPGIEIRLIRNGKEAAHCVRMEVDQSDEINVLNLLAWSDWNDPKFNEPYGELDIDKEMEDIN